MAEAKLIRVECTCSPDVHLGDGRRLLGPVKEGTKTVKHGDVAEVSEDIAVLLIDNGQAQESTKDITVGPAD
jgi:hypothetical protein